MLRNLLRLNLAASLLTAVALIVFTRPSLALYAVSGEAPLIFVSRIYGGAHLVFALLLWQALRPGAQALQHALALALCVGDSLATALTFLAQRDGLMNDLGWANLALQAFFALGYTYASVRLFVSPDADE